MTATTDPATPVEVLHVITDLDVGGAERMLATYLTGPRDGRIRHRVVSLKPEGIFAAALRKAGIEVVSLGMGRWPNPLALLRLAWLIRRWRPDVVQTWMYHADLIGSLALLLSGRRARTHLNWGIRCSDMDLAEYGPMLRAVIGTCRALSGLPDRIVANSEAGRRFHRETLGYRDSDWRVVPNSIDADRFRPDPGHRAAVRAELGIGPDAPLVGCFARVDPMKDYPGFLAALDRLPGVQALAVGKDTEHLPARPGLHRLGRRDDVERLYAACDLLVLPSAFGEGFPNVVGEAMASGVVPVATDVGDSRAIVGEVGRIVPPRDPDALAAAVRSLLDEPADRRANRAAAARARILDTYTAEAGAGAAGFDRLFREPLAPVSARPLQPVLAVASAIVSRLSVFAVLILAARLLDAREFGAFAVTGVVMALVMALVSGGGDMWLNPFTQRGAGDRPRAPRIWGAYLAICATIAALVGGGMAVAVYLFGRSDSGIGLGALEGYHAAAVLGVLGGVFAGLTETLLAIMRASGRVAAFFVVRDLTLPLATLGLFVWVQPPSAFDAVLVQTVAAFGACLFVGLRVLGDRPSLPLPGRLRGAARRRVIGHTLGLIYGNLGSRLSIYVDVLVLTYLLSLDDLGHYRAATQFAIGFMVVQHFVFLTLPWQMRRAGPGAVAVEALRRVQTRQRLLLALSALAAAILMLAADPIMRLLGPHFVDAAPIFQLYVLLRAVGLMWGPNHELLVSNGRAGWDAHANLVGVAAWLLAFAAAYLAGANPVAAAIAASATGAIAAQGMRYRLVGRAGLIPVTGHPFGWTLPALLAAGIGAAAPLIL
ncbi:MAG: glycosyltransferase [Alphaproteobacteria bacterium]